MNQVPCPESLCFPLPLVSSIEQLCSHLIPLGCFSDARDCDKEYDNQSLLGEEDSKSMADVLRTMQNGVVGL